MLPVMHYTANAEPQIIDATERDLPKEVFLEVCLLCSIYITFSDL